MAGMMKHLKGGALLTARKIVLAGIASLALVAQAVGAQSSTDQFEYDALGRVMRVQAGQGSLTEYHYDNVGNRSRVNVQRQLDTSWLAVSLPHVIGFAEPSGGWAANVSYSPNYLTYGPYTTSVPTGARTAVWRMMVDVNMLPVDDLVVHLEVFDWTSGEILTARHINRSEFKAAMSYQIFEVPFFLDSTRSGHSLEFRTFYWQAAYVNVERIGYY